MRGCGGAARGVWSDDYVTRTPSWRTWLMRSGCDQIRMKPHPLMCHVRVYCVVDNAGGHCSKKKITPSK